MYARIKQNGSAPVNGENCNGDCSSDSSDNTNNSINNRKNNSNSVNKAENGSSNNSSSSSSSSCVDLKCGMSAADFRRYGHQMVDYVADYLANVAERPVVPQVQPGYLRQLLPQHAPEMPEDFQKVFQDLDSCIMPGMTHWNHPQFHAYYPSVNSYPSILGDLLSSGLGCVGFSWIASPAATELEVIVCDWLVEAMDLPRHFLSTSDAGGAVIHGTATESTLTCMLAARERAIKDWLAANPDMGYFHAFSRLVCYSTDETHSMIVRNASFIGIAIAKVEPAEGEAAVSGELLRDRIHQDRQKGLIPFFLCATFGTTPTCEFDPVHEIGPVCTEERVWLHIDAAYAGSFLLCPEFRPLMPGIEFADSFNFNPHKMMHVNFDCSVLYLRSVQDLFRGLKEDLLSGLKLMEMYKQEGIPDFRHWEIPLGRRFRALKVWFVMRAMGLEGLRQSLRRHVNLAVSFAHKLVADNHDFEILSQRLGLVAFRMKGTNEANSLLYNMICDDSRLHMNAAEMGDPPQYFLRFVCTSQAEEKDVDFAVEVLQSLANRIRNRRLSVSQLQAEGERILTNLAQQRRLASSG